MFIQLCVVDEGGCASAPPVGMGSEHPPSHSVIEGVQECEKRWKHSKENLGREQSCDDKDYDFDKSCRYSEMGRSHVHKSIDPEKSLSCSKDRFTRRSQINICMINIRMMIYFQLMTVTKEFAFLN